MGHAQPAVAPHLTKFSTGTKFTKLTSENLKPWSSFGSCLLLPSNLFYADSNRIHTKLPVPVPHFIIRLPSSLGPTACLAMDLVQGVTGAYLFEPQHEKRGPKARNSIGVAQHRVLQSMADIQITLAQFQALTSGHLRKFPYSEYECFMVDDFGSRSKADGFGVEGDPSYCTPLDFYTSMIAKRAQSLDTFGDLQYTTSAHKILNTIRENLSSCCNENPRFYLTNVDLGARNAIFDIRGFLQAMIDVDTLRFVPIEYSVQVPSGLGIEFFPDSTASVWRADNGSPSSHMRDYRVSLFGAGARLGQCNLGASFALQLRKDSAALIQGFQVVDEEDTNYNDEWLRSESVLRLTGQKSLPDSSISQNDVQTSVAGTPNQSSEQSIDTVDANSSIQIHLPIEPDLQLSSHSKEIEIPGSYHAMPEGNLSQISQGASD